MLNLKHSAPSKIVLIGASTGGPGIIQKIITSLPKLENTSIVIAQHMARGFIPSFTKRLKDHSLNPIDVAYDGDMLENAHIYLCCGHTRVTSGTFGLRFIQESSPLDAYNPDINIIFNSFIPFTNGCDFLSIILTGIGDDGVDGCKNLSINGATCLTESANSAVVDGMPSRARESVPNIEVLDINVIIKKIKEFCN